MRKPVFVRWFMRRFFATRFVHLLWRLILLFNFGRRPSVPHASHDKAMKSSELRHGKAADINTFDI
jgi:hypothetical protein